MRKIFIASILCLVSMHSLADRVSTITVFHSDKAPVLNDLSVLDKSIPIQVYKVDALNTANKMISDGVYKRVPKYPRGDKTALENFQEGFSQLLNSEDWAAINAQMEKGAESAEYIARYKIKKVPAIIFNDKDIVYGVRSMAEAMKLFNRHGGQ